MKKKINRVTVDYRETGNTAAPVEIPRLVWPNRCACCGSPGPQSTYPYHLDISIELGRTISAIRVQAVRISWNIPYCPACLEHVKAAGKQGNSIAVALAIVSIWALVVFCGLSSIGGPGAFVDERLKLLLLAFFVGAPLWVMIANRFFMGRSLFKKVKLTSNCTSETVAVSTYIPKSFGPRTKLNLYFSNEQYAQEFAQANGVAVFDSE